MEKRRQKRIKRGPERNRAVIYTRVSGEEQGKEGRYGLEAQLSACRPYCAQRGYVVVAETCDPGISGAKTVKSRPGLSEALALCESGQADVIVCYAQDRLARKSSVFDDIRDRALAGGFRLETARDGVDLTSDENEIPAEIMSFVASLERKLIAARLKGGRKERSKRDGKGSGPMPWGYDRTAAGQIIVDTQAARVIRKLLALRVTLGYQETANQLNQARYRTAQGKRWTRASVQTIDRHADLYKTGVRRWDGITAEQRWPVIVKEEH